MRLEVPRELDRARLLGPLGADPRAGSMVSGQWQPHYQVDVDYRRDVTAEDPLRFALVYLPHLLSSPETSGRSSISPMHVHLARVGRRWIAGRAELGPRDAVIGPRGGAKSTWARILLLWALAHGHRRFAMIYSHTSSQVHRHMAALRADLRSNERLLADFPGLTLVRDSRLELNLAGGSAVMALGMGEATLGAVSHTGRRPDLLLLDDIEPSKGQYSDTARAARLDDVHEVVLPQSEHAATLLVGTVTRWGSITHALARAATGAPDPEEWIAGARWAPARFPALLSGEDGPERSMWPARWSTEYLIDLRAGEPRSFQLNFQCEPPMPGGQHWTAASFRYRSWPVGRSIVHVDPALTVSPTSDETAVCVVSDVAGRAGVHQVDYCRGRRVTGSQLRTWLVRLLTTNPQVATVVLEENAGGNWAEILTSPRLDGRDGWPRGVDLVLYRASRPKRDRLADLDARYDRREVWHRAPLPELEQQMIRYPHVDHDDLMDTVAGGVEYLRAPTHERYRPAVLG